VDAEAGALCFRFADDGPGVPSEVEHRLFEPFATAGKVGGTGLGLTVVRRIAEEHQGRIEVEPRPGGGTAFVLSLPLHGPG
jgi:signal transduction histidine kinase